MKNKNSYELTVSEFYNIVRRATGADHEYLDMLEQDLKDANHPQFLSHFVKIKEYVLNLEEALVEAILEKGRMRRELYRLNRQVQDINVLRHAYQASVDECMVLSKLLENELGEDTDNETRCIGSEILDNFKQSKMVCACGESDCPKPLVVEEDNFPTQTVVGNGNSQVNGDVYVAWDMRTRYPEPRKKVD